MDEILKELFKRAEELTGTKVDIINNARKTCGYGDELKGDELILADIKNAECFNQNVLKGLSDENYYFDGSKATETINQYINKVSEIFTSNSLKDRKSDFLKIALNEYKKQSNSTFLRNAVKIDKESFIEFTKEMYGISDSDLSDCQDVINGLFPNDSSVLELNATGDATKIDLSSNNVNKLTKFVNYVKNLFNVNTPVAEEEADKLYKHRVIYLSVATLIIVGAVAIPVVKKIKYDLTMKRINKENNDITKVNRMSKETVGMLAYVSSNQDVLDKDIAGFNNTNNIQATLLRKQAYEMIIKYATIREILYGLRRKVAIQNDNLKNKIDRKEKKELKKLIKNMVKLDNELEKIKRNLEKELKKSHIKPSRQYIRNNILAIDGTSFNVLKNNIVEEVRRHEQELRKQINEQIVRKGLEEQVRQNNQQIQLINEVIQQHQAENLNDNPNVGVNVDNDIQNINDNAEMRVIFVENKPIIRIQQEEEQRQQDAVDNQVFNQVIVDDFIDPKYYQNVNARGLETIAQVEIKRVERKLIDKLDKTLQMHEELGEIDRILEKIADRGVITQGRYNKMVNDIKEIFTITPITR